MVKYGCRKGNKEKYENLVLGKELTVKNMNIDKLKRRIIEKGYNMRGFCRAIGMSASSLYRKMRGSREFDRDEIERIIDTLSLTESEIIDIFFNQKVS